MRWRYGLTVRLDTRAEPVAYRQAALTALTGFLTKTTQANLQVAAARWQAVRVCWEIDPRGGLGTEEPRPSFNKRLSGT